MLRSTLWMLTVVSVVTALHLPVQTARQTTGKMSYDEFTKLSQAQRDGHFAAQDPEGKAALMRAHLERWLDVHRADLNDRQIALVKEVIEFASPALYRNPQDTALNAQQEALGRRLSCSLGSDLASTISPVGAPPRRIERTWSQAAHQWVEWIVTCVVK